MAINLGERDARTPVSGEVVVATEPTDGAALRPGGASSFAGPTPEREVCGPARLGN